MKKRVREWVRMLPITELEKMLGWQPLLIFVVFVIIISFIGKHATLNGFFYFESLWSIPVSAGALFFFIMARAYRHKPKYFAICLLVADSLVHAYFATIIITSTGYGSIVFTAPWIFCGALHGGYLRTTFSAPFMGIGITTVTIIALFLSKTPFDLALCALTGFITICSAFIFGNYAVYRVRMQRESEQLRSAVLAQRLREEAGRVDQLSVFANRVAMFNHDIRNTLTIAIGNTSLLERLIFEEPSEEDLNKAIQKVRKSLSTLSANLRSMADLSREHLTTFQEMERIEIIPMAEIIIENIRPQFENIQFTIDLSRISRSVASLISGGSISLRRILENLVINACEGNGDKAAQNVLLNFLEKTDLIEIQVKDDGPGFLENQLASRPQIFRTTKPEGSGLGLYTAEQLVLASGGLLEKSNVPSGGAMVSIKLPKATPI